MPTLLPGTLSRLVAILGREVPACAFGIWTASVWLAAGYALTSSIPAAGDPARAWAWWSWLSFFGGVCATVACQAASFGRTPRGWRVGLVAIITASLALAPLALVMQALSPFHAWREWAVLLGVRLAGDAACMSTWIAMRERLPGLADLTSAPAIGEFLGRRRVSLLAFHGFFVCLPVAVVGGALLLGATRGLH